MNNNALENSWKDFTAQLQKQHKIWSKITDDYFEKINNARKEMTNSFQEQCAVTQEKAEEVLEKTGNSIKKMEKDVVEKFTKDTNKVSAAIETKSDTIKENWELLRVDAQKKWSKLTNDNLEHINGSREKLSGAIQKQYGIARDEADRQMSEWEKTHKNFAKSG